MMSYSDVVKAKKKRLFSEPCEPCGEKEVEETGKVVETGKLVKGTEVVSEEGKKSGVGHSVLMIWDSEKRKAKQERKMEKARKAKKARCVCVVLEPV
jgi:hypothetical protein